MKKSSPTLIVALGGTVEAIDSVRVLTNLSRGGLGRVIVEAALARGLRVHALVSTLATPPPPHARLAIERFTSARDLAAKLRLRLTRNRAQGTAAMCKAFALPALRRLRIERNSLGDTGAIAVAECAGFANLTSLEMGHNRIGAKGGAALAASPHFTNLERLTLNEPRWKPETEALFGASPTLANAKIYLKGKLVGRKTSKAPTAPPAEDAAQPKAKQPRAKKPRAAPKPKAAK